MNTFAEIKSAFNKEFKKVTVKYDDRDGIERSLRSDGKLVRRIPTHVQLSPMDVTNVKSIKIEEKFQEMVCFLTRLGGTIKTQSYNHAMVEFISPNGKKALTFSFFREQYRASYMYDSGYKNIFFNVVIEVI